VLVVDDDPATRDMIVRGLREESFRVETAADGRTAEERARPGGFDAILMDVVLPDIDGFTLCRRLRARRVDTPILLFSGRDRLADRVRGLDAGADDYLAKPLAFAELVARLRAVTRRGRTRHLMSVLRSGPIAFDQVKRTLTVHDEPVAMTDTELQLVECLLLRADRVVPREELAQHVWGGRPPGRSNVIDVYISYVRKKLGREARRVRTVRGLGYMISSTP
jgi:two-component system response regulator MprA